MPYKDKGRAKEYAKIAMRKRRGITQYPAILKALVDPIKRRKLEKIYQSLRDFKQEKNVYLGYPDKGVPFDLIGELLEATR